MIEFASMVDLAQDDFRVAFANYDFSVPRQNELAELFTELTQCIDKKSQEFQ